MGSLQAREMAEMAQENGIDIRVSLQWHLQHNHFPPVPAYMVEPCLEAINAVNEEDFDKLIGLPEGVGYKGLTVAPAHAIVSGHHLEPWIELTY